MNIFFTGGVAAALANLQTAEALKAQRPAVGKAKTGAPEFKMPTTPMVSPDQASEPQTGSVSAPFNPPGQKVSYNQPPLQKVTTVPQNAPMGQATGPHNVPGTMPSTGQPVGEPGDLHALTTSELVNTWAYVW